MAGFRSAVLLAAACAVLLPAASQSSPAVYGVGDEMGWAVPPAGATDALTDWAARHRFLVGDVLDFKYGVSNDSVLLVRHGDYERCSAASPLSRLADGGGATRFTLGRPGLFYFIGGTPARCEAGQRMVVRVVDARRGPSLASGAPTPVPETQQPFDTQLSGNRGPTLAKKHFPAAVVIGFGAGFVLILLFVWVIVCVSVCAAEA